MRSVDRVDARATPTRQGYVKQCNSFVQNLTAQLIVFSTGGEIDFSDRESIQQIMNATRANDFRMRDLIHEIVQSRIFREL